MNNKTMGLIILVVAIAIAIIGIRGTQNAIFGWLPSWPSGSSSRSGSGGSYSSQSDCQKKGGFYCAGVCFAQSDILGDIPSNGLCQHGIPMCGKCIAIIKSV